MKKNRSLLHLAAVSVAALCVASVGCAGSDASDVLNVSAGSLSGSWSYTVDNAYEASFTDCTGDAGVLEGKTFFQGLALAPVCVPSSYLNVDHDDVELTVLPHDVRCGDGSAASMNGVAAVNGTAVSGQWESADGEGRGSVQAFSGVLAGDQMQLLETSISFSGGFGGTCGFSPPLRSTATLL